ncbi:DoxX family protein [Flavobacterium sp. ZT3R18]|uniref:DoxX family protein n=1 Tax=Flavobacterium sp. ZT3R18 TaxID=2594429 RepID=UPI00117A5EB7|nr:DoxX family protein [Flavobacterium sp. ZT3R18]TRX37390.1 DoxX family protein [Flavobacterium sp. ZT3R18]
MNTTLWIIQGILATVFSLSGLIIYLLKNKLASKLSWLNEYSPNMVLFICTSKIVGALGLILPVYFKVLPILTPIAGFGLATIMILAIAYHFRKKEYKDLPAAILFLALSLFVAFNRF